jgi:hypothetical protein
MSNREVRTKVIRLPELHVKSTAHSPQTNRSGQDGIFNLCSIIFDKRDRDCIPSQNTTFTQCNLTSGYTYRQVYFLWASSRVRVSINRVEFEREKSKVRKSERRRIISVNKSCYLFRHNRITQYITASNGVRSCCFCYLSRTSSIVFRMMSWMLFKSSLSRFILLVELESENSRLLFCMTRSVDMRIAVLINDFYDWFQ